MTSSDSQPLLMTCPSDSYDDLYNDLFGNGNLSNQR